MKILSDEKILIAAKPYTDEELWIVEFDRAIARAQHLDTLRQVRELLDGIETGRHPSKPHETICCMYCGHWNIIDDEVEQAKHGAIKTMKALLEE